MDHHLSSPTDSSISVVMPVHNAEAFVAEAIESILAQTHSSFEFIIVLDSCTDDTATIVEQFAKNDKRIRVLQSTARNSSDTRNIGIEAAKGDYIAFMDADDIAYPKRLERQYASAIEQPDVVLWGADMMQITDDRYEMSAITVGLPNRTAFDALDRTQSLIRIYGTVAFARKDIILAAGGFDRRMTPNEDGELWDRMAVHGPVLSVPEILQSYRQHKASLSRVHLANTARVHDFVRQRNTARVAGRELTFETFLAQLPDETAISRLGSRLRVASLTHVRRAKIERARGNHVRALGFAMLAVAVCPYRFIRSG